MKSIESLNKLQINNNSQLIKETPFVGDSFESKVLPFTLDLKSQKLTSEQISILNALEKKAARIAIESLGSLAKINEIDHLGGGLELIPALLMTLSLVDYETKTFTIEHAHTSIGYYSALASLGFISPERVINSFRRGLDIAGHVSWVPGGTELNGGRLGVMVPVAVGQALGIKAHAINNGKSNDGVVYCHCGDAGWISGQALNGFIAASLHKAPTVFLMHRNGIQLSNTTEKIMNKDPRPIIESLGVTIIEISSFHDKDALFGAYKEATKLATNGTPSLIYPLGFGDKDSLGKDSSGKDSLGKKTTVKSFGEIYGIEKEVAEFATKHAVELEKEIWVPGSLMSFRDSHAMIECVFYVNNLSGGEAHHDGGMKGRDVAKVLSSSMIEITAEEEKSFEALKSQPPRIIKSTARPKVGTKNLTLDVNDIKDIALPNTDKWVSPRAGSELAYLAIAKKYPKNCFFVSCDLDPSTKLGKASAVVAQHQKFELSIQEQIATLICNGLSTSSREPQLNVFATFTAFMEGIAREGFEMWRYQRNLNGINEGLNVVMHMAHVGACTGRDHFSGWSLDWINMAIGYLPYLRRFYAPSDSSSAFLAVIDSASEYGGHMVAIPRDNLPVITKQDSNEPLWNKDDKWSPYSLARKNSGAKTVYLTMGAPSYLAIDASEELSKNGTPTDVYIINGLPLTDDFFSKVVAGYDNIITIEDGAIGTINSGLRGFAAFVNSQISGLSDNKNRNLKHFGIVDPRIAPSEHFFDVWKHFGMTKEGLVEAGRN